MNATEKERLQHENRHRISNERDRNFSEKNKHRAEKLESAKPNQTEHERDKC